MQAAGLSPEVAEIESVQRMRRTELKQLVPTGEVHPVADLFPMMTDQELDDLAADIKAHGLIHPIVLDTGGMLIDGRNRLEACRRASVEPVFETLNGHEPREYVFSANDPKRRNTTQGQRTMLSSQAYRDDLLLGNKTQAEVAAKAGVSQAAISQALLVLEYAPDCVRPVIDGTQALKDAYFGARDRLHAEERKKKDMARLEAEAPDLAVLVKEERLALPAAIAMLDGRIEAERARIDATTRNFHRGLSALDPGLIDAEESAQTWLQAQPDLIGEGADFSADRARRIAAALTCYAARKESEDNG